MLVSCIAKESAHEIRTIELLQAAATSRIPVVLVPNSQNCRTTHGRVPETIWFARKEEPETNGTRVGMSMAHGSDIGIRMKSER
jgi:hypothetical protein